MTGKNVIVIKLNKESEKSTYRCIKIAYQMLRVLYIQYFFDNNNNVINKSIKNT